MVGLSVGMKVMVMVWFRAGSRPLPEKASWEVLRRMDARSSTTTLACAVEWWPGMKKTSVPLKVRDTRGRTSSPSEVSKPVVVVKEPLKASLLSRNCLEDASVATRTRQDTSLAHHSALQPVMPC